MSRLSPPADRPVTIAAIDFESQVVLWALRTLAHDPAGGMRVHGQFRRALSPSASRIAFGAAMRVFALLEPVRPRADAFGAHGSPELSPLERRIADLCVALCWRDYAKIADRVDRILLGDDAAALLDALITLVAALQHGRRANRPTATIAAASPTLH